MKYNVIPSKAMQKAMRKLRKKYPKFINDLDPTIQELKQGHFVGDKIKGFSDVYKARVPSSDQKKGKRGGFRVIYYVVTQDKNVYLLSMYAKAHQENITDEEIRNILNSIQ